MIGCDDPDIASKYLSRDGTPLPHIRERDGVLWLDERILVPVARVHDVLSAYHNDGHWGRSKTVDLVNSSPAFGHVSVNLSRVVCIVHA